jgi:hypothetical protein
LVLFMIHLTFNISVQRGGVSTWSKRLAYSVKACFHKEPVLTLILQYRQSVPKLKLNFKNQFLNVI